MSAKDIKAGRAWVELSVMDRLDVGLKSARAKLASFAKGVAIAGAAVVGAASAVIGVLGVAAKTFADAGSKLFDMQAATGLSAEELSGLGFAADQSGASLEALGAGLLGVAKFTLKVHQGAKAAVKVLTELGISSQKFLAASPLERLLLIADALTKIEDAGLREGLAGKLGLAELLPMLSGGAAGLQAMINRAAELNLIVSGEEAKNADALGDAWDEVNAVWRQIGFVTGAAVAEVLTSILTTTAELGAGLIEFIRNNQALVLTVGAAAVAALALGNALLAIGAIAAALIYTIQAVQLVVAGAAAAWAALGTIKAGVIALNALLTISITGEGIAATISAAATWLLNASLAALGGIVAALLSPLAIAIVALAAIGAAIYVVLTQTEAGHRVLSVFGQLLRQLGSIAMTTFQGIWDALMAGNWQLAGEVAMRGLEAAWVAGINALEQLWLDFKTWLLTSLADLVDAFLAEMEPIASAFGQELNLAAARNSVADFKHGALSEKERREKEAAERLLRATTALQEAVNRAAAERESKRTKLDVKLPDLAKLPAVQAASSGKAVGTFSATAAANFLPFIDSSSPQERTAKATEETAENTEDLLSEIRTRDLKFA